MTPDALGSTNFWLAAIAITSAVQLLVVVAVSVATYRACARMAETLAQMEWRHVAPLAARATAVLEDVHDIAALVRRADESIRDVVTRVDTTAGHLAGVARERVWPLIGAWRGLRRGLAAFTAVRAAQADPRRAGGRAS